MSHPADRKARIASIRSRQYRLAERTLASARSKRCQLEATAAQLQQMAMSLSAPLINPIALDWRATTELAGRLHAAALQLCRPIAQAKQEEERQIQRALHAKGQESAAGEIAARATRQAANHREMRAAALGPHRPRTRQEEPQS